MLELNKDTFDNAVNASQPAIVDFWAEWCMPCKIFAPALEELSDELDGKAGFFKVNIDENPELAQKYNVEVIPTVIIFKNGEALERTAGVLPKEQVKSMVEKYI